MKKNWTEAGEQDCINNRDLGRQSASSGLTTLKGEVARRGDNLENGAWQPTDSHPTICFLWGSGGARTRKRRKYNCGTSAGNKTLACRPFSRTGSGLRSGSSDRRKQQNVRNIGTAGPDNPFSG